MLKAIPSKRYSLSVVFCTVATQTPITGFAIKLKDDLDAVRNGITYEWSNGQVEGQVNRLKMLKRQMYGRASHELLKKRFLYPV